MPQILDPAYQYGLSLLGPPQGPNQAGALGGVARAVNPIVQTLMMKQFMKAQDKRTQSTADAYAKILANQGGTAAAVAASGNPELINALGPGFIQQQAEYDAKAPERAEAQRKWDMEQVDAASADVNRTTERSIARGDRISDQITQRTREDYFKSPEYLASVERAKQPFALERAAAGADRTTINTGSDMQIGPIPAGQQVRKNPDGSYVMSPITGSPAATEAAAAAAKAQNQQAGKERQANIVTQDIDRALDIVNKSNWPTTGFFGNMAQGVAGSPAHDVKTLVDSVKSNVGFDKLQAMREASPTGGALGSVTEREMSLLQSTLGSLEQSQSKGQFTYNMRRVKDVTNLIVHGPAAMIEEAKAAIAAGANPEAVKERLMSIGVEF